MTQQLEFQLLEVLGEILKKKKHNRTNLNVKTPPPTPASTAISIYTEEKGADQATSVTDTLFSSLMKCPYNFNSKE